MSDSGKELEIIKNQLISGSVAQGSILAKVMNELTGQQLQELKMKAAEGMLALELEKLSMSHNFQASSVEISEFINRIKELEGINFKASGEFKTASGTVKITAKRKLW